ncbi:MAG: hypothetical protein K2L45_12245 [Muribaculaceae bacterium]|nr:hypothetical protein [Muribaculaceae bacterium]
MFSWKTIKKSVGIICAIVGLTCYVIAYAFLAKSSLAYDIILNIADVLIIGVVVGYLSSVAQWAGVFKKEIQDIVFGKKLVGERKDIEEVWSNVTKQMFKFKFADIHKKMLYSLKEVLPSEEDISYYEDYDADSKIEWVDKDRGIIKCYDNFSMFIVVESDKKFDYTITSWLVEDENQANGRSSETLQVTVDNKKLSNLKTVSKRVGSEIQRETIIPLSGKKRYFIQYSRVQQYCIFEDYYIAFRAKYITNGLKVSLELPSDIEAIFIERGTMEDFQNVKNTKSHIKKLYKGVIFPKQGYIFALKVK